MPTPPGRRCPAGTANATVCGQYVTHHTRYYAHCGSSNIEIRVIVAGDHTPDYWCVPPGDTYVGPTWKFWDATSTRRSC